ncbi:uncharacterized protein LOC124940573 [Impatiens glandulifera]|uniref:uncharacterized protein LOC124940573 n=1 Tax=Impatiens glandulifera TaxID=253017 RepID=UPI001FB0BA24|nr:uncharacterized protein LOC124940573 [Impatiens glandulifera]
METPISSRRITRSQTKAAASNNGITVTTSDPVKGLMESRQRGLNQSALFDITNDSPVFGLAIGEMSKRRSGYLYNNNREITTPGSGEALLRDQVKKILLQKVEEESELSKISMNEIVMEKGGDGFGPKKELMITRSLLPEFLDESAEDKGVENKEEEEEEKDGYDDDSVMVNELCDYFIKRMNMNGGGEKTGKHTRFVYNSDDEIQGEEDEEEECKLRLKGIPTPKGKHVRFPEEEE